MQFFHLHDTVLKVQTRQPHNRFINVFISYFYLGGITEKKCGFVLEEGNEGIDPDKLLDFEKSTFNLFILRKPQICQETHHLNYSF